MPKKEYYKHILPHFQQPGQAYFVTWNLKDAVPPKALKRYSTKLEILKSQLGSLLHSGAANFEGAAVSEPPKKNADRNQQHPVNEIEKIKKEYYSIRRRYIKAYNNLLDMERNPSVDLSKANNTNVVADSLKFFQGKKLENYAFCIMPNHVHWVFKLLEKDENGKIIYLEDILYSVKRFSAGKINKLENREGALWQKESFDTTIRDDKHLYYAIEYTLNNPVKAGYVKDWKEWPGCWLAE